MKVYCARIPEGDTLHIEGEEDASTLGLEDAGATASSPLRYSLDVGLSGGGLFATGRMAVRVRFYCVCCLNEFDREIVVDPFATQIELGGSELIDLTPVVREDIHLTLPPHPRCDSEGGDKCPAKYEGATLANQQQPGMTASAWDVLDKLKP